MTAPSTARPRTLDGSAVAVATSVMNVATYGFTMLAARIIGTERVRRPRRLPRPAHRRPGRRPRAAGHRGPPDRGRPRQRRRRSSSRSSRCRVRVSLAPACVMLALAPVVTGCSRLDDVLTAVILAARSSRSRWRAARPGSCRASAGGAPCPCSTSPAASPGSSIGTRTDPLAPRRHERRPRRRAGLRVPGARRVVGAAASVVRPKRPRRSTPARAMLMESVHNAQVLFVFFALSSVDIVIARNVLDEHDAGLYAAGLIMTKVMLFLPQFVVVVAFPAWRPRASATAPWSAAWSPSASSARSPSAAAELLSGVAMVFVGGAEFARGRGAAVGVRGPRHGAGDAPAAGLRRAGAPGATLRAARLGWPWSRSWCWGSRPTPWRGW